MGLSEQKKKKKMLVIAVIAPSLSVPVSSSEEVGNKSLVALSLQANEPISHFFFVSMLLITCPMEESGQILVDSS